MMGVCVWYEWGSPVVLTRAYTYLMESFRERKQYLTRPWWSSGLEHHSFILVMLKHEGSNPGGGIFFSI